MFVLIASKGLYSHAGTCFSAAAWTTISTPSNARIKRSLSRTSPIKNLNLSRYGLNSSIFSIKNFLYSYLENTMIFLILGYLLKIVSINFLPKLPVPPVTKIVLLFNIYTPLIFFYTITNVISFQLHKIALYVIFFLWEEFCF